MNTNAAAPTSVAGALPGIEEKRFLVTGATSGIGLETARLLAELGATVAASGRRLDRLAADLEAPRRGRIVPIFGDLTDPSAADAVVASAVAQLGPLDGLVHSAGIIDLRPLRMTSAADLDRLYRINVEAGVLLAKAFRRKAARRGSRQHRVRQFGDGARGRRRARRGTVPRKGPCSPWAARSPWNWRQRGSG